MDAQKVFITSENTVTLQCPSCMNARIVDVGKLSAGKHLLKIKCSCNTVFKVQVEFRKKFRKETNLQGLCTNLSRQLEPAPAGPVDPNFIARYGGDDIDKPKPFNCIIKNISKGGLGMSILGPHTIVQGDELLVEFNLDNAAQTLIEKKVIVRFIKGDYAGCQFTDGDVQDTALGFYLL